MMDYIDLCEAVDAGPVPTGFANRARAAALAHVDCPLDPTTGRRSGSPLHDLLPDDRPVSPQIAQVIEQITARPLADPPGTAVPYFANPAWRNPARARSALHRWAVRTRAQAQRNSTAARSQGHWPRYEA